MTMQRAGRCAVAGLVLALASLMAHAGIPYKNHLYEYRQPSGEKLRLHLDGNDYYAEQRTDDGSLVVYDAGRKGFCYAELNAAGDNLVSTGVLATNARLRSFNTSNKQQPGLSTEARARRAREKYLEMHGHPPQPDGGMATLTAQGVTAQAAVTGQMKGLTVIIDFPDLAGTISKAQVESFLNDPVYTGFGNAQSVRGYYLSVSGNKLDYTNTVTRYYRARYQKSYYADSSLSSGVRSQELITEALNWLKNSEGFDFSTLSRDSNNRILGLNFFYAGEADSAWSKGLWPHMGWLNQQFCSGSICSGSYQISNMGTQMAIGTFSHETGHLLMGWPDLYDYDGSSEGSVASYCLMGFGGIGQQSRFRPSPPVGYFRYLAGWDTVTELNPALNRSAPTGRLSHTSGSHNLYRWTNQANTREAFYVEAIHQSEQNLYQPGQGLAIFHIDPAGNNSDEWHPYVQMEHADGRRDPEYNVNRSDAGDVYDGVNARAFHDTMPNAQTSRGTNSKWWNGYASGFGIANIAPAAKTIAFDLVNGDGSAPGTVSIGYLQDRGTAVQPWFQYAGGTLNLRLSGPAGADFDLQLDRWDGVSAWVKVAESTSPTAQEAISYNAASGYYRITAYSYSGAGNFTLTVVK